MAVFTEVTLKAARPLFDQLAIGELRELRGIAGGIENTNYFATTDRGEYVLTLFERLSHAQLPFYLHLMRHLARRGIPVPLPQANAADETLFTLCGKPAAVVDKLRGQSVLQPAAMHCAKLESCWRACIWPRRTLPCSSPICAACNGGTKRPRW